MQIQRGSTELDLELDSELSPTQWASFLSINYTDVMSMEKSTLPIEIQTFRKIREEEHYYVDKTTFARELLAQGDHFFLSRPRRFGKSLF